MAGVIGHPIAHSRSPHLQGYWLKSLGLQGYYIPMDVTPEDLPKVIETLPKMGFVGVNITVPHKERVIELADLITDRAAIIGAANTLIFQRDGRLHADNTDGYGFIENLRSNAPGWDPKSGPAAVIGAGGAARAVVASLLEVGVPEILISNRTRFRAEKLKSDFGNRLHVVDWAQVGNMLDAAKTVVNTTSLGMVGKPELGVPLGGLQKDALVTDLVYTPLKTRLLSEADAIGCTTVDGLGMLLHQAVPGFERWFGIRPEVDDKTRRAVLG